MPGFPVLCYLPEFAQTHGHWISNAIQPSHSLSYTSLPALNLSQHQGLFQWVSSSYQVAKVLELRLQHQSFHNTSYDLLTSLISFRIDWLDLLAVQGTLKSLIQHHSSKASILWDLAFFIVQQIGRAHVWTPVNTQDWSPLGWTGWISLQSKGLSRVFSNTIVQKHQF